MFSPESEEKHPSEVKNISDQLDEESIQEDLIEELHQAWAEEQSLKTLKAYSAVCEHASQQVVVVEVHRAWDEEESPRIPK
ncbi:unnamed protein product, partial [Rangifer tarandus platyrhynchus]